MTIDEIALLRVLAQRAKDYYHRKNVYRFVLAQLKANGVPDIDEIIGKTLQAPDLLEATDRDFAYLDQRIASIAGVDQDQALREYLAKLPPTDPN
jgi:hypothetical protein